MTELFGAPIEEIIRKRISVRTYSGEPLGHDLMQRIREEISALSNPFGIKVNYRLLASDAVVDFAKLGTYGIIKGAQNYIGTTVKEGPLSLVALGYEFEELVLRFTSLGLGTCWMGGTFKRSEFAKAMDVKEGELFPIISPVGYAADKKSFQDAFVRFAAKGDKRKDWSLLFFDGSPDHPLSPADAGAYETPLEMVRIAPSASNKQPWRIIRQQNGYHFFLARSPGYGQALGFDIQSVDMGIALCHFYLTAEEKGLEGKFETLAKPPVDHTGWEYYFSWFAE